MIKMSLSLYKFLWKLNKIHEKSVKKLSKILLNLEKITWLWRHHSCQWRYNSKLISSSYKDYHVTDIWWSFNKNGPQQLGKSRLPDFVKFGVCLKKVLTSAKLDCKKKFLRKFLGQLNFKKSHEISYFQYYQSGTALTRTVFTGPRFSSVSKNWHLQSIYLPSFIEIKQQNSTGDDNFLK